jgi:transcriptional regulator with XRE-family HTH domain
MRQQDLPEVIATRVREARHDRGWTLDDLASRAGVSRRMLVNIEQASTNPTIAVLLRISDALGIGLPALVEAESPPRWQVTRAGEAPVLWTGSAGGQAALVAGTAPPDVVELWDWTLEPGESHSSEAHAAGTRELLLVLDGRLDLRVGTDVEHLERGDSATFAGDTPHGYAVPATATTSTRFVLTVFQPRVGQALP